MPELLVRSARLVEVLTDPAEAHVPYACAGCEYGEPDHAEDCPLVVAAMERALDDEPARWGGTSWGREERG